MSVAAVAIRSALEIALYGLDVAFQNQTAWENRPFTPTVGTAYQRPLFRPNAPENPSAGSSHRRENGTFVVMLHYPSEEGSKAAAEKAQAIRDLFARGKSFTDSGITVNIPRDPHIGNGVEMGRWWVVPVTIRWYADVFA